MTVLDRLEKLFPQASRTTLREMLRDRRVTVNGLAVTSLKEPLAAGDSVQVLAKSAGRAGRSKPRKSPIESWIVFEDDELLVVNKPHRVMTSSGPNDRRPTLLGMLRAWMKDRDRSTRVGLVHRLDADAAGLIVFSKNNASHDALKLQFEHHTVEREYVALLDGVPAPAEGSIRSYLLERADGRVRETRNQAKGVPAVTHYQTLASRGGATLVRVRLETGRKHQIRAHFAERSCPIVNDPIYNPRKPEGDLRLRAVRLALDHPRTGARVSWSLETPGWL